MSARNRKRGKRNRYRIQPAAAVIAAVVLLALCGILIGLKSGAKKREALEADRQAQIEQASEEEAEAQKAKEAEQQAIEEQRAKEEEASARQAEMEKTAELLAEQARQANSEDALVIKDLVEAGIPDVGAYATATAVVPEEIALPAHTICLDPTSTGISDINLVIVLKLKAILESRNYAVVLTRSSTDTEPSGPERAAIAQTSHSEIMVSVQTNESGDASLMGCTAYGPAPGAEGLSEDVVANGQRLSQLAAAHLSASAGCANRGYEAAATLNAGNWSTLPWTIVAAGFYSNPDEAALLYQDDYQNRVAAGIANGIDAYFAG